MRHVWPGRPIGQELIRWRRRVRGSDRRRRRRWRGSKSSRRCQRHCRRVRRERRRRQRRCGSRSSSRRRRRGRCASRCSGQHRCQCWRQCGSEGLGRHHCLRNDRLGHGCTWAAGTYPHHAQDDNHSHNEPQTFPHVTPTDLSPFLHPSLSYPSLKAFLRVGVEPSGGFWVREPAKASTPMDPVRNFQGCEM